jgi:transcriptional regulator with XRE-family HTH domain
MKTIAQRIREALDIKDWKQIELSEKAGLPKSAISQYLSGKVVPKQDKIYMLSQALDVSPVWLMGYDVPINLQPDQEEEQAEQDEVWEIREMLHKRPELKILFDASNKVSKEDIETVIKIVDAFKKKG